MFDEKFSRLSIPAFESIDFQGYDPVCKKLIIAFEDFRVRFKDVRVPDQKEIDAFSNVIQKILRDRFKLNELVFKVFPQDFVNAFAIPPDIVKNSVMVRTYGSWLQKAGDGRKVLENDIESAVGSVNRANATVGGFFQKVPCTVGITYGMAKADDFTNEEIVAALLHEVGHIFSYLETLAYTFSTCFTLFDTVKRLDKAKNTEEKVKIFKGVESATGVTISNQDMIAEASDNDTIAISIFSDIYEQTKSEFGASIYDMRSWESLSDQFSSRMGMTVPLATALDKIMRSSGDTSYSTKFQIWSGTIIRWVVFVLAAMINPVLSIFIILELLVLLFNPFKIVYDKPGERLERLRQEILQQMKTKNIPAEQRLVLSHNLETITALIKATDDKELYYEKVWLFFSSKSRDQKAKRVLLQDLQSVANNNLFAAANLLQTLK